MAYLVSGLLEQLSSILLHETKQKVRFVVGVDKEVKHLTCQLQAIKLELADAERRQWREPIVKGWLDKLHEICYELNDILDEWITAILKSENDSVNADQSMGRKPKRKQVCSMVYSSCFHGCGGQVGLLPGIASKIINLNKRVEIVVKEAGKLDFKKSIQQHVTPSFPEECTYGIERHKEDAINFLLSKKKETEHPSVLAIVGNGGVGKTTIADQVYNDKGIAEGFEEKMWVCVSDPFDEVRVAKAIFESLKGFPPNSLKLEGMLNDISVSIHEKKFLLVLDDVWEDDDEKWEKLKNSLSHGASGSKVLVTTRKESVAEMMSYSSKIPVTELSDDDCWSLFRHYAFSENDVKESEDLVKIGKRIVKKCKGLPLLAKIMGSLMRYKNSREEWQSVLDSKEWRLYEDKPGFCPLLLCYLDLPSNIRRCFSYCAIFPKDRMLEEDKLIMLWMAEGYLRATQSKEMEMIGAEYFQILAARSFFQNFVKDTNNRIIMCKMHDLVHEFAQYLTGNECVSMDQVESPDFRWEEARHFMFQSSSSDRFPVRYDWLKKLRTLLVESESDPIGPESLSNLFRKLTCLRTLKLSNSSTTEIPAEIRNLIHLRHLDLSNSFFLQDLPEEICELYNLLTLDLSGCWKLKMLPQGICRLINLRYLKNKGTYELTLIPRGIERLISLRELDEFVVHDDGRDGEASNLGDLKHLNRLQKRLEIRGLGNLRDTDEAKKAHLKKKRLITLVLSFDFQGTQTMVQDELIEALEPPPNLENLSINVYTGITVFPSWMMSLAKLSKVILHFFPNCKQLPPMGKLPSLEHLEIKSMASVRKVGIEFLGIETDDDCTLSSSPSVAAFPKLKVLKFCDMYAWEEWDVSSEVTVMPFLLHLDIQFCLKLNALPVQLLQKATLKELTIMGSPILNKKYHLELGEDQQMVSRIPIVQFDFDKFLNGNKFYSIKADASAYLHEKNKNPTENKSN